MKTRSLSGLVFGAVLMAGAGLMTSCVNVASVRTNGEPMKGTVIKSEDADASAGTNPLLEEWTTPYGLPPFDRITEADFLPAVKAGIEAERAEIDAIIGNPAAPTFENTILAMDRSGRLLEKVLMVFFNLQSAETTPGIQAIARDIAPLTTALNDDIYMDRRLFDRVDAVWATRATSGLDAVQVRLVEETRKAFVRAGAALSPEARVRLRDVNQELAVLGLKFGDNLLAETNAFKLVIENRDDLAGLTPATVETAARAAEKAGMAGKWLVTLSYPSMWPFVQQSTRRDLRRQVITAYAERCNHGNEFDNNEIIGKIGKLRLEKANLLGYPTWADFVLEERMAKTPAGVSKLMDRLWKPALAVAKREAGEYTKAARRDGVKDTFMPWDWHYYAERMREQRYGIDSSELRQYFRLDDVLKGAFGLANKLYGITFTPVADLKLYNPDVQAWEVTDADGSYLGLFLGDYHPRPGKRVGAWSSRYRSQEVVDGRDIRPVVVNVGNFTAPTGDTPALLSSDEVETLFHELGHGLHSLLAKVPYRTLAGVPRDFVELPSQIMENWAFEPQVLAMYARHYKTGEPIPAKLVEKIQAAARHNQGYATVEFLAAAQLDMAWHESKTGDFPAPVKFEDAVMARLGMPVQIIPRYRSNYFNHIFGGSGSYSAGYYSYIWSEVLDADAFEAFKEAGDLFDPATATSFRKNILERGGMFEAEQMYRAFRGRDPDVKPMLKKRGLIKGK